MAQDAATRPRFTLRIADELAGTGRTGLMTIGVILVAMLIWPLLSAMLVLAWLLLTRKPFAEIGLQAPDSWARVILWGIVAGLALKFLVQAVVLPYLGGPMFNSSYQYIQGDLPAAVRESFVTIALTSFAQEIVYRGFLLNRAQAFFGSGFIMKTLMILATAAIFGVLHMQEGPAGIAQAALLGGLFTTIYFLNGQRLWLLIFMHAAFDIAAVWMIYLGLEEPIARIVFG